MIPLTEKSISVLTMFTEDNIELSKKAQETRGALRKEVRLSYIRLWRVVLLRSYIWALPKLYSLYEF